MEWVTYCHITVSLRCLLLPEMLFKQVLHLLFTTRDTKSAVPRNLLLIYSMQLRIRTDLML